MIDMRRDLMMLVHDNKQHPTIGRTLQQLKEVAYWSTRANTDGTIACRSISGCANIVLKGIRNKTGMD